MSRDGAMEVPNLDLYRSCVERWPTVSFQASGGVRDTSDLDALAACEYAFAGRLVNRGDVLFTPLRGRDAGEAVRKALGH